MLNNFVYSFIFVLVYDFFDSTLVFEFEIVWLFGVGTIIDWFYDGSDCLGWVEDVLFSIDGDTELETVGPLYFISMLFLRKLMSRSIFYSLSLFSRTGEFVPATKLFFSLLINLWLSSSIWEEMFMLFLINFFFIFKYELFFPKMLLSDSLMLLVLSLSFYRYLSFWSLWKLLLMNFDFEKRCSIWVVISL